MRKKWTKEFHRTVKTQKGFIQIPILIAIIAGVSVLSGAGYFGIKQYQNYQIKKVEQEIILQDKEKEAQVLAEAQQKVIEETRQEIDKIKTQEQEKTKNLENELYAEKVKRIEAETKQKAEEDKARILEQQRVNETKNDLPTIISFWRPRIAKLQCAWMTTDGEVAFWQTGSGLLVSGNDMVITNQHVFIAEESSIKRGADFCLISFPDQKPVVVNYTEFRFSKTEDVGLLEIKEPSTYMKNLGTFTQGCKNFPPIGEKIVILGYPTIGSSDNITATDGIISGRDGFYYITSAKIEHGNSGGTAIYLKDNCILGIPTSSKVGEIESLGRILDFKAAIFSFTSF